LPWFNRKHVREKHPKYFHEDRRWRLTSAFVWILWVVALSVGILSTNPSVRWYGLTGELVLMAFNVLIYFKLDSLPHKYAWRHIEENSNVINGSN
jgi:hypothetical protein